MEDLLAEEMQWNRPFSPRTQILVDLWTKDLENGKTDLVFEQWQQQQQQAEHGCGPPVPHIETPKTKLRTFSSDFVPMDIEQQNQQQQGPASAKLTPKTLSSDVEPMPRDMDVNESPAARVSMCTP